MSDCRFAFQFLVDSVQILNICFDSFEIFKKGEEYSEKDMLLKPLKKDPDELYEEIFMIFNEQIIEKITILLEKIVDDPNVELFVSKMLNKLLTNIRMVNRCKMERIITIIKVGINPNCTTDTMEALCELEHYVDIFYPPNRQFLSIDEKIKFLNDIFILLKNNKIDKLVDNIDINRTSTTIIKEMLKNNSIKENEIYKTLGAYGQKVQSFEPPMMSVNSLNSVIELINENACKKVIFSQLCISNFIRDDEMYIYYYGYINKKIAGSFSLDFTKLKNIIKGNYTYYIFYFVTCCYCLNDKINYLGVNFEMDPNDVPNMFIFLSEKYLSLFREKINKIKEIPGPDKIFKHLNRFLNNIIIS